MPIRVVLAEDHYLVREGLRRLLETRDDLEVVSVCSDLDSLLATVEAEQPDVVVTDIRMPPGNTDEGIQAATRLRETNPEVGVVVLSQYAVPTYVLALLDGGSARRAYLLKERVTISTSSLPRSTPSRTVARSSTRRSSRLWWRRTLGARSRRSTS